MIIACPVCQAQFELSADSSSVSGRQVQCGQCGNIWRYFPSLATAPQSASLPQDTGESSVAEEVTRTPPPEKIDPPTPEPVQPPQVDASPKTEEIVEAINDAMESEEEPEEDPEDQASADDENPESEDDGELAALRAQRAQLDEEDIDSGELEALRAQRAQLDGDEGPNDSEELAAIRKQRARLDEGDQDNTEDDQLEKELAGIASPVPEENQEPILMPKKERKILRFLLWFLLSGVLLGGGIFGILYRQEIMEVYPKLSVVYQLVGLAEPPVGSGLIIENINVENSFEDGQKRLSIHADLSNISNQELLIPSLRAALEGKDGDELEHWIFNLKQSNLMPGEIIPFKTMINDPPRGIISLSITFVEKSPSTDMSADRPSANQPSQEETDSQSPVESQDTEGPKNATESQETERSEETEEPTDTTANNADTQPPATP